MQLDQRLAQRQPRPVPAWSARQRVLDLGQRLQHALELVGRKSRMPVSATVRAKPDWGLDVGQIR